MDEEFSISNFFSCICCKIEKKKVELTTERADLYDEKIPHQKQTQNLAKLQDLYDIQSIQNNQRKNFQNQDQQEKQDSQDAYYPDTSKQFLSKDLVLKKLEELIGRNVPPLTQPKLILEIMESKDFEIQQLFTIFPSGYQNSQRGANDGVTIFGTHCKEFPSNEGINIPTADIIVKNGKNGFGGKHFAIYFDIEQTDYKVMDLYQGQGTFILLSNPIQIKKYIFASFGNSHLTFDILFNNAIQINFLSGALKGQKPQEIIQNIRKQPIKNKNRKTQIM